MTPCPTRQRSQGHLSSGQEATSVADHKPHTSCFLCKVTCCPYSDSPRSKSARSRWHLGSPVCWGPPGSVLPDGLMALWCVTESRDNTWNIRVQVLIYKSPIKLNHLKKEKNGKEILNELEQVT